MYLFSLSTTPAVPTQLYRLTLDHPGQVMDLVPVCSLPASVVDVRDASLSPGGRRLALCGYKQTLVFDLPPGESLQALSRLGPTAYPYPARRIEGCAWESRDSLLLAGDLAKIFRLKTGP